MIRDPEIRSANPWWTSDNWQDHDPHLVSLARQSIRLPNDGFLSERLDLHTSGIHTVRGPRQVGKSTQLKLLVQRARELDFPARRIIYLALDLLEDQPIAELAASVRRAKELSGERQPSLLLLDEVTAVSRWQTAIKALWDEGTIRDDVVVCTGSSAIDLQKGMAERLPGRRGKGEDHLLLPQSFAAFAHSINGEIPISPFLSLKELSGRAGQAALREARLYQEALQSALASYLRFGGLPAAVAEAATGAIEPSKEIQRIVYDSLLREFQRKGANVPALHALLERILRSLGSKTNWSRIAREMDVPLGKSTRVSHQQPSHHTVRDYVELLASAYFLLIIYFWRSDGSSNSLSQDKKLYIADPLLQTVSENRIAGLKVDLSAQVENAVAMALYRHCEPIERQIETFVFPDQLHCWQTKRGGEIDFVCGPRKDICPIEVKYQSNPSLTTARSLARAFPNQPAIVVTKDTLAFHADYTLIPAASFLWAMG